MVTTKACEVYVGGLTSVVDRIFKQRSPDIVVPPEISETDVSELRHMIRKAKGKLLSSEALGLNKIGGCSSP